MRQSQVLAKWGLTFVLSLGFLAACNAGEELEKEVEEEELEDAIEEDVIEPVGELEEEIDNQGVEDAVEDEDVQADEE
ncbi:hypothetical protein [Planococcus donghaensis]|uniref:DNA primase n=1 Tax=Planococcus donghaensis TaxID=414778 RepID=A0A1C7EGB5_9BACL|nr:hypothetical protein [Planococcus donghaensis]ANU23113.1 hypothetical protein BCM40_06920 [Planococcus donghaensis]